MDLQKLISDLRSEREQIDQAMQALTRLALMRKKSRGRRPKWLSEAADEAGSSVSATTSS
jgi:hypothetical protein